MIASIKSTDYLNNLKHDLINAGLKPFPIDITDMSSLVNLILDPTNKIGSIDAESARLYDTTQRTQLGRQVLRWHNLSLANNLTRFSDSGTFTTCEAADPGFVTGLKDNHPRPSLILTSKGEPVGVSKPFGVKTTLGLKDMPEIGLLEGVICSNPLLNKDYMRGLPNSPACSIDIQNLPIGFSPRRVSVFAVPTEVRTHLSDNQGHWESVSQTTSIEELTNKCEKLLLDPDTVHLTDRFRDFFAG